MNILELNLFLIIIYAFILLIIIRTKYSVILFSIIITVQMIIFNGLRYLGVGIDTYRYYNNYLRILYSNNFDEFKSIKTEIGYNIFEKVISIFTNNFNIFLLVVALFVFVLLGIFIYKYSKNYFFSYLLYIALGFYDFSFTGIRQTIAMIIVLFTYKYILNRSIIKYLVTMGIAISFHTSAIVFLPIYFIANIKWKKYHLLLIPSMFIIIYFFRYQIGEILTLLYYDEATKALNKYQSTSGISGLAIMILLTIVMGFVIYNPIKYRDKENIVLSNIMIVSLFIQILSSFSYLFTRLNMFYLIFIILYIPNILNNIYYIPININKLGKQWISIIIKIIIIIIFIMYYFNNIKYNSCGIIPYSFFWEQ